MAGEEEQDADQKQREAEWGWWSGSEKSACEEFRDREENQVRPARIQAEQAQVHTRSNQPLLCPKSVRIGVVAFSKST